MIFPKRPELDCRVAALRIVTAWHEATIWRLHVRGMLCPCDRCCANRARWAQCREQCPHKVLS